MALRKKRILFLCLHAAIPLSALLFLFYLWVIEQLPARMSGCLIHDFLLLYCPLCGGTRAVQSLCSLDLLSAIRYNAVVVLAFLSVLVLSVVGWYRFFKGKNPFVRIPAWVWISSSLILVAFFVLRNLLMIFWGFDPTGDLGTLWNIIMKR